LFVFVADAPNTNAFVEFSIIAIVISIFRLRVFDNDANWICFNIFFTFF
jgi:hypothetical protein